MSQHDQIQQTNRPNPATSPQSPPSNLGTKRCVPTGPNSATSQFYIGSRHQEAYTKWAKTSNISGKHSLKFRHQEACPNWTKSSKISQKASIGFRHQDEHSSWHKSSNISQNQCLLIVASLIRFSKDVLQ